MVGARIRLLRLSTTCAFLVGVGSADYAMGWLDDFNDMSITDGNPVTWGTDPLGFFPGNYDASTGDLALSHPGDGNNNQLVTWIEADTFTDTYIRAQGIVLPGGLPEEVGGNLALLGRLDNDTISGYVLYIDSGGQLGLQVSLGGALTDLTPAVETGLGATSDVIIELNIVGMDLSGFAWRPGDPKPATPQITATDPTFASGHGGIAYDEDDDNTTGVFRFAAAQGTPFVDDLPVPGDYNDNGIVDAADYTVWRDTLGSTTELAANGDDTGASAGVIDAADYDFWKANFGAGGPGAGGVASAIPEPTGFVLTLVALAAVSCRMRRCK